MLATSPPRPRNEGPSPVLCGYESDSHSNSEPEPPNGPTAYLRHRRYLHDNDCSFTLDFDGRTGCQCRWQCAPVFSGMRIGGDGLARLEYIGTLGYAFQALLLSLIVAFATLGVSERHRTPRLRAYMIATLVFSVFILWRMVASHLNFIATGETSYFMGFPARDGVGDVRCVAWWHPARSHLHTRLSPIYLHR